MIQGVGTIWARINDIATWLKGIEKKGEETSAEVQHLKREMDVLSREIGHGKAVTDFQGKKIAELEAHVKKLQSEKHGAKVSAGKAKAKVARLENGAKH